MTSQSGHPARLSGAQVKAFDSYFGTAGRPLSQTPLAHTYRYSPITPLNSAPGLHAVLSYTYDTSVERQSEFELPIETIAGLSLTGNQEEQTDRDVQTGWIAKSKNGWYHRWIWADYYFIEYGIGLPHGAGFTQWEPDHFQGTVSDNNPQKTPKHKVIGSLNFSEPKLNCGPGHNWCVRITSDSLPWTRSTGTREENGIGINYTLGGDSEFTGGSMSLADLMTYASITSVTWSYVKGCGRGYTRVVYGYRNDPVEAGRVLASCAPNKDV